MQISHHVEELQRQLLTAAAAGGPEAQEIADRLTSALEAAARLTSSRRSRRRRARSPASSPPGRSTCACAAATSSSSSRSPRTSRRCHPRPARNRPAVADDGEEGATSRTTLRLPDSLKSRAEAAADGGRHLAQRVVRPGGERGDRAASLDAADARQLVHGVGPMSAFAVDGPTSSASTSRWAASRSSPRRATTCRSTSRPATPTAPATGRPPRRSSVDRVGDGIVVKGPYRLSLFGPGDSVDVVVRVPEDSDVVAVVKYGSARLAGKFAGVRADVPYGEFSVDSADRSSSRAGTATTASRTSPATPRSPSSPARCGSARSAARCA